MRYPRKIAICPVCHKRDCVRVIKTQVVGYVKCLWIVCTECKARGQYVDTEKGPYPVRIRPFVASEKMSA